MVEVMLQNGEKRGPKVDRQAGMRQEAPHPSSRSCQARPCLAAVGPSFFYLGSSTKHRPIKASL